MIKKYINKNIIQSVPRNGYITIDGMVVGVSNLKSFLESNQKIAIENGYYEYETKEPPIINEDERIVITYSISKNKIIPEYQIEKKY